MYMHILFNYDSMLCISIGISWWYLGYVYLSMHNYHIVVRGMAESCIGLDNCTHTRPTAARGSTVPTHYPPMHLVHTHYPPNSYPLAISVAQSESYHYWLLYDESPYNLLLSRCKARVPRTHPLPTHLPMGMGGYWVPMGMGTHCRTLV
jgi:hypothetical protein